jgi:hypothetical protein
MPIQAPPAMMCTIRVVRRQLRLRTKAAACRVPGATADLIRTLLP